MSRLHRSGNPFLAANKAKPIVVGHRGVPRLHQENSLAGFRRAVELGVPAIELDARLTADRRVIVFHDHSLTRLTGEPGDASDLTWDQIAKLRIRRHLAMGIGADGGSTFASYEREEPIALLEEVLAEISPRAVVNVELKLDFPRWWAIDIGEIVARVIADAHAEDRVIVTSFDPRKLAAARRVNPQLSVGFCFDDGMLEPVRPFLDRMPPGRDPSTSDLRPGHNARRTLTRILDTDLIGRLLDTHVVGAEHTLIGEATVRRLHAKGVAVGTHTLFPMGSTTGKPIAPSAMTEAEVHRLVALGVDWIETDDPERLLPLVG